MCIGDRNPIHPQPLGSCGPLQSLKHLRTQIDYIHEVLLVILLDLDWKSLRFTGFHSLQASGGGTACRFLSPREPGQLVPSGLHGESRSRSQTVLEIDSLLYVSQMIYYGHKSISGSKLIIYMKFQNIFNRFIG